MTSPAHAGVDAIEPVPCSRHKLLGIVAVFALAFIAFGLAVDSPQRVGHGLIAILSSRDTLITDYIGLGGIGAAFVNAG
ncbi:MAG: DUF1576 domain-containing protein, partial [Rubrivivax sp.]